MSDEDDTNFEETMLAMSRAKRRHPASGFQAHRVLRARKTWECDECHTPITPGTVYECFVTAAWQDGEIDVNDEGHAFGVLRDRAERRWSTERFHVHCFESRFYR